MSTNPIHGRGADANPANRFIPLYREAIPGWTEELDPAPRTRFFHDASKSILTHNDSPDIPFTYSINPYRGCEHGCIYCFARPNHEYLGLSAGLDFESQIFVKEQAPELLRKELSSRKWVPQRIGMAGVTDVYQPIERRIQLSRRCLEVLAEFRNPVGIVTKNALVTRDRDILGEMAKLQTAIVYISITTLDENLARVMEPRASSPQARLRAVRDLREAGIPVGILMAPVIPGLNDHEVGDILSESAKAGACSAGYVVLRLPFGLKDLFSNWLEQHYPARKEKVLGRLREARGGQLNDPNFGTRMSGQGEWAEVFRHLFQVQKKKCGLDAPMPIPTAEHFTNGKPKQLSLFE
jgi:DNA repair photolyase